MAEEVATLDIQNAALDVLETLVGQWRIEISDAEFLDDGAKLVGRMSGSWLDGRAFLLLRSEIEGGPPAATQVVGRNEDRDDFTLLYADERGVSRVYAMTFANGEWVQVRTDSDFHQRFAGRMIDDGTRIEAAWMKSHDDGKTWHHDFDVTYLKS